MRSWKAGQPVLCADRTLPVWSHFIRHVFSSLKYRQRRNFSNSWELLKGILSLKLKIESWTWDFFSLMLKSLRNHLLFIDFCPTSSIKDPSAKSLSQLTYCSLLNPFQKKDRFGASTLKANSVILSQFFFVKFLTAFLVAFSRILKYLLERNSYWESMAEREEKLGPLLALGTQGWISLGEECGLFLS